MAVPSTNKAASEFCPVENITDDNFFTQFEGSSNQCLGDYVMLDLGAIKPLSIIGLYFVDNVIFPSKMKLSIKGNDAE